MPDPDRLLHTLDQARLAFLETSGRRGHFVDLEGANEVLVVGDLHGHVDNFRRVLATAELADKPARHLVLQELVHGPFHYPNGGDKSHQLVDLVAALKCQYRHRVHLLLGNHELAQWTGQWIAKDELDLNEYFNRGLAEAYGPRADEIYAAYLALFAVVPVAVRTANRVLLTHSLPSSKLLADFDPERLKCETWEQRDLTRGGCAYSLLWGRDTSQDNADAFLRKMDAEWLITGHIPCDAGFAVPNNRQIILDAKGTPAAYCLFPTDRAVTHQELVETITLLP